MASGLAANAANANAVCSDADRRSSTHSRATATRWPQLAQRGPAPEHVNKESWMFDYPMDHGWSIWSEYSEVVSWCFMYFLIVQVIFSWISHFPSTAHQITCFVHGRLPAWAAACRQGGRDHSGSSKARKPGTRKKCNKWIQMAYKIEKSWTQGIEKWNTLRRRGPWLSWLLLLAFPSVATPVSPTIPWPGLFSTHFLPRYVKFLATIVGLDVHFRFSNLSGPSGPSVCVSSNLLDPRGPSLGRGHSACQQALLSCGILPTSCVLLWRVQNNAPWEHYW